MAKIISARNAKSQKGNTRTQAFSFVAPTASSVQLAGDFTNWEKQPINLGKDADGVWRTSIELECGAHYYRFLVDGQWCDDPNSALRAPNPFGTQNAVRQVV